MTDLEVDGGPNQNRRPMIISRCRWRRRRGSASRRPGPGSSCIFIFLRLRCVPVRCWCTEDGGPITLDQLTEFLGRSGCQVRIQPVLDPTEVAPVDGCEIPARLRAAVRVRQIADVFPFGTCLKRNIDIDHTEPYVPMDYGGPPGQTRSATWARLPVPAIAQSLTAAGPNASPSRLLHLPLPAGYLYLVTNQGTLA